MQEQKKVPKGAFIFGLKIVVYGFTIALTLIILEYNT